MSNIAVLFNVPTNQREMDIWTHANMDSHRLIVEALQKRRPNSRFDTYALDPLPQADIPTWLLRHQIMHNQMDPPLGIGGNDYTGLQLNDPLEAEYLFRLHANEHIQAHTLLGITG